MSTKAALKAAKTALDNKQYDQAIEHANSVLSSQPQNHFATLFLARALELQQNYDEAATQYRSAADARPDDPQAWQGLLSVYEAQGAARLDEYRDAAVKVAGIFAAADDKHRAQSTIDKLTDLTRLHGTALQKKRALEVLLPGGPIYEHLEGRIPHPSHTFTRLAEMTELEETRRVSHEIAERRTRIGATVGQVTLEVKREVFASSPLEGLYQQVIDWSTDDEVRRQYEEKLLQRAYDHVTVLPAENKAGKLNHVLNLAEGMVIIHHPFQLAWDLVLESRDVDELKHFDAGILREYVRLFPASGLSTILRGWLTSELSPFPAPPDDEQDEGWAKEISPEERLLLFTDALPRAETSPFAYRLVGDYYLHLDEHESAVDTARAGIRTLQSECAKLGLALQNTRDAIRAVLGTALVQYQAPRNHAEARRIFEDILSRKPQFTPALIGLGLIFEETEDYPDAIRFLTRAFDEDRGNVRVGTELAWCRALDGDCARARAELEGFLEVIRADDTGARDLRALTLYRTGVCLWQSEASKTARRDRNGAYRRFLAAVQTNVNFAPAYTSLGTYYADYAKDKKRARQCFQKAFELSPNELEAAERLAKVFADQGDWDIVEVIAQRVVDSGRARPPPGSKKKGVSWPYSALGVAQMNKQDYRRAIASFLAALRISPDHYQAYVGLGESYHNSGRHNSALRTFRYALDLHDGMEMELNGETWFTRYMLSNVHRELGDYDEAASGLRNVLEHRPCEFGVLMSLLHTQVEHAGKCVETGLFGRAVECASDAIDVAIRIARDVPNAFNLWKGVGDACSVFSWVQSAGAHLPREKIREDLLEVAANPQMYELLSDVDAVSLGTLDHDAADGAATGSPPDCLALAILAYKRAIHTSSHDVHAQAVAWYNLGWAEHRAYACCRAAKSAKKYLTAAVRCFKGAIELEPGNAELWNGLGIVTTTLNAKVAQHSFVRSLHLNERDAKVWANLGVLYLVQNDVELAHQSFGRALSTDPECAEAWVGEGIVALVTGDARQALDHFTHAFEISDSASCITKRQYAVSSFDHLRAAPSSSNDLARLIQPLFALEQLRTQLPNDLPCRHLAALLLERVGNHAAAMEALTELCERAEAEYECSESLAALARFAVAKSDLARNQLAAAEFADAAENAATALDLSSDADSSGLDAGARRKLRLSCQLTAGLAQYRLRETAESVSMFKAALMESENDADVVCTLACLLWAQGGEGAKEVAREQLLAAAEKRPEHVGALTLLGAMAASDDDAETARAVRDDLLERRTADHVSAPDRVRIASLVSAVASLAGDASSEQEAQSAVLLTPDDAHAWSRLARCSGAAAAAEMALQTASQAVPPCGDLEAADLSMAFAGVGTAGDAQRAIVMAPWQSAGWSAMCEALGADA